MKPVNYTLEFMKKHRIRLTRANYLAVEYMGCPPAELDAEVEAELPSRFRKRPRAQRLRLTAEDRRWLRAMKIKVTR
jgi:hypothetical protein